MTRNQLKWIALITMTIDHIGLFLLPSDEPLYTVMRIIGRISFPLFAFMIAEGFLHTSSVKHYVLRLLALGIFTEVIFLVLYAMNGINLSHVWFLEGPGFRMNILWTLLLGLIGLELMKKYEVYHMIIIPALFLISVVLPYGFYGFGLILIFGTFSNMKQKWGYAAALTLIYCFYPMISAGWDGVNWIQLFALLALPILMFYNGKRGLGTLKWVYFYYPLHIVMIYLMSLWT
jgi:hypothetical protein